MFTKTTSTIISALLGAAALTSAAPTGTSPSYPPTTTSNYFQLVANITGADLSPSIQNWMVQTYHTGAGTAVAVLVDPKTSGTVPSFYVNGTAYDVRFGQSGVVMDTPTLNFPMSIQATQDDPDSEGRYPINVNAGLATTNVGFKSFPDPFPTAYGPGYSDQTYYACQAQLEWGPGVGLYFQWAGQTVPEGCVPLNLVPQCSAGSGTAHDTLSVARCYTDVASIDWSLYGPVW